MGATLDDILKIPGNRPIFEDLQRLLIEKKAIAFVGAGASAGMYPLWGDLIRQLCEEAVASGFASEADRQFWLSMADTKPAQVVRGIRQKVTSPQLGLLLRNIFGPKPEGQRFTPVHAALLRIPFSGYVTTNYDPGLIEARLAERPAVTAAGWSTWRDGDEFGPWRDPARLADPTWCPVLFAHGFYQRTDTIVLGIEEYRRAYEPGPWRRLFEHLWTSAHLVFAGFGFSDPFLDFITSEIVTQTAAQTAAPARHIAFVGLGDAEPYSEERRRFFLQNYDVQPIFYPVAGHDHAALLTLLDVLALKPHSLPQAVSSSPFSPSLPVPSLWVHETSNDEKFTGREDERARLDRWVADPAVRAIGITAVGGTGKTALVGDWLKRTGGWRSRPFEGLFAWSFYQNRDSKAFLTALLKWANEIFGTSGVQTDLVIAVLKLLRSHTLVIVLDGLEVLQEGPEKRYGAFLDGTLRELLGGLCAQRNESLAVLTSRFVFADLERHLGTAFHQLELPGLAPDQGAALLAELEVRGSAADRVEVSRRLEGHPLGLRVVAEAIPEPQRDYPRSFLAEAFRTLPANSPLADKLRRLLIFYQEKLPLIQVRLLGVVALFRSPVAEKTILRLVRGLFAEDPQPLSDDTLGEELTRLRTRGVLTHEPTDGGHGYACHPILREHFRAVLLGLGAATAKLAADLLQGQPSEKQPHSVREIEPVLLAIEVLLDAGDFRAADKLYWERLENGQLFKSLIGLPQGLRCALGFVLDKPRRQNCEEDLLPTGLVFYLNEVGLFASLSGDYELAALFLSDSNALDRELGNAKSLSRGLMNEAELSVSRGNLGDASTHATEALALARDLGDEVEVRESTVYHGWVLSFSGQLQTAAENFAVANELEKRNDREGAELYSGRGLKWAYLLASTGHSSLGARRTLGNLRTCERHHWNDDSARCHWVLAVCALARGGLNEAEDELRQAEHVFHSGQMLFDLARLHVTGGLVALARRDAATALQRAAEALALAQPRGMRLVHADALVLRGQARLLEASGGSLPDALARALDDAEDALRIARDCGYAWAERDALALQADANTALAKADEAAGNASAASRHRDAAHRARTEAEILAAKLRLTEEDLAAADAKAEVWLAEWEKQQKLKP